MLHKYSLNNYEIVVDVNSGAVHCVDKFCSEILDCFMDYDCLPENPSDELLTAMSSVYSREAVQELYSELLELQDRGELFSPDTYAPFTRMLHDAPVKSMCLNIAHDCNLRCEYCFAGKGDFGRDKTLMPFEVGKKAIDFLIVNSGKRHNLEVDFFGGEPLMNFDVVKQIVEYARSLEKEHNKNFRFTITTNGVLLDDEKIDYINREMSNVVLSFDGRKDVHDRFRRTAANTGTYDLVLPKFIKLTHRRGKKDYYVRGTFTRYNLDFSEDVLWMHDLGYKHLSIEPVIADKNLPYAIREQDLPQIFQEYEWLAEELVLRQKNGEQINFFHFNLDLQNGPCAVKRLRGCSCGNEYIAVTPEGDIYPCHQFVGQEDTKMGNVLEGTFDRTAKEIFADAHIYNKAECMECWARFYCSGGCNANNKQYRGSIFTPHRLSCEIEKKRLECAIMMQVALSECCHPRGK